MFSYITFILVSVLHPCFIMGIFRLQKQFDVDDFDFQIDL
jgi:hypothetical protein